MYTLTMGGLQENLKGTRRASSMSNSESTKQLINLDTLYVCLHKGGQYFLYFSTFFKVPRQILIPLWHLFAEQFGWGLGSCGYLHGLAWLFCVI